MVTIEDLYETDQTRQPCPACGSSDGVKLTPNDGDTGVAFCHACQRGWTGAQLYAEMGYGTLAEALSAFGVDGSHSDVSQSVAEQRKRLQRARQRQEKRNHQRRVERMREWCARRSDMKRIRPYLTDDQQEQLDFWRHDKAITEEEIRRTSVENMQKYRELRNNMLDRLIEKGIKRARTQEDDIRRLEHSV